MISKKRAAIGLAIGALIGLQMSGIYVPEDFQKPILYKLIYSYLGISGSLARLAENYGWIESEAAGIRLFTSYLTRIVKSNNDRIKEVDTKIEGVNVRIYTPKVVNTPNSPKYRPILVYYHGGGFAIGTNSCYFESILFTIHLDTFDAYLQEFVKRLDMIVISVDYKMTPEHPFPKPVDECLAVTKYVLHNAEEFGGDSERVVLAGDSAGGNAAAVITQTLLKDKSLKNQPKLQVLIYPWVQMVDQMGLPSCTFYAGKTFTSGAKLTFPKYVSWYLGIRNVTEEIELSLISNSHFALIDENERKEIISYLDPNKVPNEYKKDRSYYDLKANDIQKQFMYPSRLDDNHLLKREPKIAKLFKNLFSPEISPLLADSRALKGLPKAYIIILEWDYLKDESILYAERLKEAGVDVFVKFYENAFHGQIPLINHFLGFKIARDMQNDLIKYLKENI